MSIFANKTRQNLRSAYTSALPCRILMLLCVLLTACDEHYIYTPDYQHSFRTFEKPIFTFTTPSAPAQLSSISLTRSSSARSIQQANISRARLIQPTNSSKTRIIPKSKASRLRLIQQTKDSRPRIIAPTKASRPRLIQQTNESHALPPDDVNCDSGTFNFNDEDNAPSIDAIDKNVIIID